jgi:multidrug resistance efflux pump
MCGWANRWQDYECRNCKDPRYYQLSQRQALAVKRELDRLERERDDARADCAQAIGDLAEMYDKQPCGHEARFIVSSGEGTNWCALCQLDTANERVVELREEEAISRQHIRAARDALQNAIEAQTTRRSGSEQERKHVVWNETTNAQYELDCALEE